LAWLALFLSLAGTAVAARPLLTGADIADETITGADVRDRSLRARHLRAGTLRGPTGPAGPPGPPGPSQSPPDTPFAYVEVGADGSVTEGDLAVTSPAPGVYCAVVPNGARWAHASSRDLATARRVSAHVYGDGEARTPCPDDAAVRIDLSPDAGPFLLVVGTNDA
jgi:hypothetical protein